MTDQERTQSRYLSALNRVQSTVAADVARVWVASRKLSLSAHVGVKTALLEHGALVGLLKAKGLISDEEYFESLADFTEIQAALLEKEEQKKLHEKSVSKPEFTCKWLFSLAQSTKDDFYKSGCGEVFCISDDVCLDTGYRFCPGCGLSISLIEEKISPVGPKRVG